MADATPQPPADSRYGGRFLDEGPGLRQRTARGTMINAAFIVALTSLGFLRGFVVAVFLTTEEYGLWGILVVTLGTITTLKLVGINDKFVQQDEDDQVAAFQKAFTLDAILNVILFGILLVAVPLFTLLYGQSDLLLPGFAISFAMLAASLQAPLWIYYRRMQFFKQRALSAIDPVAAFVVTVALAASGMGYWSLVIGTLVGIFASGIVIAATTPYPLRFRYDKGTLREYYSFSWPLFVSSGASLIVAQTSIFFGELTLGLAGAGAIALASSIAAYTNRVDQIVTQTLYPAICAVKDQTELLYETFVKSNRLALMWGMPFGVGLAIFAPDLVHFVLGDKWEPAVTLLQAFGIIAGVGHIGFNWTAFFRARAETKPIAAVAVVNVIVFVAVAIPLLALEGLNGFAVGMGITTLVSIIQRTYYLTRLFPAFGMIRHALRAMAPSAPAAGAVLLLRAFESGDRSGIEAAGQVTVYFAVTIVATILFERELLREMAGYMAKRLGQQHQTA